MRRLFVLLSGVAVGATSLSIALGSSAPLANQVTDDSALHQRLSEIRVPRQTKPNFDADIQELARMENRYQERLPKLADSNARLSEPMKRVSQRKYQYAGQAGAKKSKAPVRN